MSAAMSGTETDSCADNDLPTPASDQLVQVPSTAKPETANDIATTKATLGRNRLDEDSLRSDVSMKIDPDLERKADGTVQPAGSEAQSTQPRSENKLGTTLKKRKRPGQDFHFPSSGSPLPPTPLKRTRIDTQEKDAHTSTSPQVWSFSPLPPEIWHHIFTFCPPKTLGNLLLVNKLFHSSLDPSSPFKDPSISSPSKGLLSTRKPDSIWRASRRPFSPPMPSPLRSMTELESWRLVCSARCQGCGKPKGGSQADSPNPERSDATKGAISAVWQFAIRVCGSCLLQKTIKVRRGPSLC